VIAPDGLDAERAHLLENLERLGPLCDEVADRDKDVPVGVIVDLCEQLGQLLERAVDVADEEDSPVGLVEPELIGR
jgi:hypothetical protein